MSLFNEPKGQELGDAAPPLLETVEANAEPALLK